ncbi:MAG: hypothetical protein J6Q41_06930 [Firmicutes bacterium]|nr:hypothetical protein [Bacillota bacterium]
MEVISVRIDTGDGDFDRRLGRRLCELYEGFSISFGKRKEDREADIVIDESLDFSLLPVSELLSNLSDQFTKITGKAFYRPKNGLKKLYFFSSPQGGSGLSSVAFVFARQLAMREGEKVLYIDCGDPGSFPSMETSDRYRSQEELIFLIRSGRDYKLKDFTSMDHYGVEVLIIRELDIGLLRSLELKAEADSIVISKREALEDTDMISIKVYNARDSRMTDEMRLEDGKEIKVINREYVNREDGNRVLIADDSLSFKNPDGRVRIAMDGDFAYGVEKLLGKVKETYG